MQERYIDGFDLDRIIKAAEEPMLVKPQRKPKVLVVNKSGDEDTEHVVNLDDLTCTCEDFRFNCQEQSTELDDDKYCKHIFRVSFERSGLI